MKVKLEINGHEQRMALIEILRANGYKAEIVWATACLAPHPYIEVKISEQEVEE
jgi:hypothetical protein